MKKFFDRALSAAVIALAAAAILMYGNLIRTVAEEKNRMEQICAEYLEVELWEGK
jgi:hypothetical protein